MSQVWRPLLWTGLTAVILTAADPALLADDSTPAAPPGYKNVQVDLGGKSVPIRVQDVPDPLRNVSSTSSDGKYHPENIFSAKSSMADKTFSSSSNLLPNKDSSLSGQSAFATKTYNLDPSATAAQGFNSKARFNTASIKNRTTSDFDKSFATASAGQNQSAALGATTASEQGRTAALNGHTVDTHAALFADKAFQGPEEDALHHRLNKLDNGQMLVTDLPNRPLTVDEVRDLINHGFKPDTDVKPSAEASKPLNDPDYQAQPLREEPAPPSHSEDDKDDPVPPPGTMSTPPAPENSEPLPQP